MSILPNSPKHTPPAKKRHHQRRMPLLILGGLIALFGTMWMLDSDPPLSPDECQSAYEGKLKEEVAIIIDASDAVANKFSQTLWGSHLRPSLGNLPTYTRVRLYSLDTNPATPSENGGPTFFCAVPPWRWYLHLNHNKGPWIDAIDSFRDSVQERTYSLLETDPSDSSPLLERLSMFAADAFSSPVSEDFKRELWIISDMLQHSEDCSFYGITDCVDGKALVKDPDFPAKWKSDLSGVAVKVLLVPRASEELANVHEQIKYPQDREAFWRTVFIDGCGAESVDWQSLYDT
ncbi:MAG: hypothetical protein OXI38_06200 [Bacteroidota bacterium]|nr:hypothetical protein [Bacteroidota bacterium]